MPAILSADQRARYARQIALPEIGAPGQARLARAGVLIVGAGGLGSPAAFYLAAAGIGKVGIMDPDRVELGNLQRQILHATASVGIPKTESAALRLRALNPDIDIRLYQRRFDRDAGRELIPEYECVVDAMDNFEGRYAMAEACQQIGKPYIYGGIDRYVGQVMTVLPGKTACLRCLFPEKAPAPPASPQGPLGVLPGVIGAIQATEAVKYLLGIGVLLTGRLLSYDALAMAMRTIKVKRSPRCPLCGKTPPLAT